LKYTLKSTSTIIYRKIGNRICDFFVTIYGYISSCAQQFVADYRSSKTELKSGLQKRQR